MPKTDHRPDNDRAYPDADLVGAYIVRRGVKTFHVASPDASGLTPCEKTLADLILAGWARGLRRQGLSLCSKCAGLIDLDVEIITEAGE